MPETQLEFEAFRRREQAIRLQAQILAGAAIRAPVKDLLLAIFQHPAPAGRGGDSDYCPTLRQLAGDLGKAYPGCRRQLQYLIAEAIGGGWLLVEHEFDRNGAPRSNRYRFQWGAIQWSTAAATAPPPTRRATAARGKRQRRQRDARPAASTDRPARGGGACNARGWRTRCAGVAHKPAARGEAGGKTARASDSESDLKSEVQNQTTEKKPAACGGGWQVTVDGLRDAPTVDRLYLQAVGYGWFPASEQNRLGVHAAAIQARTKGRTPERLFTALLRGRAWENRANISEAAIDAAARAVEQLDRARRPAGRPLAVPELQAVEAEPFDMEQRRRELLGQLDRLQEGKQ